MMPAAHGACDEDVGSPEAAPSRSVGSVRVSDVMSSPPVTARPGEAVASVVRRMLDARIGSAVVVDPDAPERPVGIVTRSDLQIRSRRIPRAYPAADAPTVADAWVADDEQLQRAYRALAVRPVEDVMSAAPVTIDADATVWEATERMLAKRVGHLPVVDRGRVVGMLTRLDLLKSMLVGGSGDDLAG